MSSHDAKLKYAKQEVQPTADPEVKKRAADYEMLASLPPELRALVRRLIVRAADSAIFYTLKYLDDIESQLIVDGQEILQDVRREIHALPLTEEGWFARYSKYGERGDAEVP